MTTRWQSNVEDKRSATNSLKSVAKEAKERIWDLLVTQVLCNSS